MGLNLIRALSEYSWRTAIDIVQKITSPKNTWTIGEVDNKAEKNHTYITQVTFIVNKV